LILQCGELKRLLAGSDLVGDLLPLKLTRPRQFFFEVHDLLDLHQKPTVHPGEVEDLLGGEAGTTLRLIADARFEIADAHIRSIA
jgi:hypothetical protein